MIALGGKRGLMGFIQQSLSIARREAGYVHPVYADVLTQARATFRRLGKAAVGGGGAGAKKKGEGCIKQNKATFHGDFLCG